MQQSVCWVMRGANAASTRKDRLLAGWLYALLPFEEARENGVIFERGLIVIEMFSDALLEVFPRAKVANVESQGYPLELRFLLGLESARVHGCCHRVRRCLELDGGEGEGQYELNQHQQIAYDT